MASPLSLLFPKLTKAGLSCTAVQERPASFTSPSLKSGMTHVSVSCMCMLRTGYFWRTEVLLPQSDCLLFLRREAYLHRLRDVNSCQNCQIILDNSVLAALDQSGLLAFLPHSRRLSHQVMSTRAHVLE